MKVSDQPVYVNVSPKNAAVSPNGGYHPSHYKYNPDDMIKQVTQHFWGEQPWGPNEFIGQLYTKSIHNLTRLPSLASKLGQPHQS
jgi:hypothetical protein